MTHQHQHNNHEASSTANAATGTTHGLSEGAYSHYLSRSVPVPHTHNFTGERIPGPSHNFGISACQPGGLGAAWTDTAFRRVSGEEEAAINDAIRSQSDYGVMQIDQYMNDRGRTMFALYQQFIPLYNSFSSNDQLHALVKDITDRCYARSR